MYGTVTAKVVELQISRPAPHKAVGVPNYTNC